MVIDKFRIELGVLASFLLFNTATASLPNQFGISAQIGPSSVHASNSTLQTTEIETDTLHQSSNSAVPELSLGVNYTLPFHHNWHTNSITWLSALKTEINVRYFRQKVYGDVYQFQEPAMNNYDYQLSINSTRLMLDEALTLFTAYQRHAVYILGGIGNAWNQVGYKDSPLIGIDGGSLNINDRTNTGFAYELGAGYLYTFDKNLSFSLEYRYAHFPTIQTGTQATLNGISQTVGPARLSLFSQTLALGINWNF